MNLNTLKEDWADPEKREELIKVARNSFIGAVAIMLLYAWIHNGIRIAPFIYLLLVWADSITISGLFILIIAGCVKLGRMAGFWDWISYTVYQTHVYFEHEISQYNDFEDYRERKERSDWPLIPVVVVGAAFFIVGCILSYIYVAIC